MLTILTVFVDVGAGFRGVLVLDRYEDVVGHCLLHGLFRLVGDHGRHAGVRRPTVLRPRVLDPRVDYAAVVLLVHPHRHLIHLHLPVAAVKK